MLDLVLAQVYAAPGRAREREPGDETKERAPARCSLEEDLVRLRHAIACPARIVALIIQNGDIYEDALGPKYETINRYWSDPSPENRAKLEGAVNEESFRAELVGDHHPLPPTLY